MMAARVNKGMYGLSGSGMDVDDMVKKMMMAQQARYDKMYKSKAKTEWQKQSYNTFNKSLTTFRFETLGKYNRQSSMSAKGGKVADETIVSMKPGADAATMAHDIKVEKLSSNAYLQSTKLTRMKDDGTLDPDSKSIYMKDFVGAQMPEEPPRPKEPKKPKPLAEGATQDQIDAYDAAMQEFHDKKVEFESVLWPQYVRDYTAYDGEMKKTAFSFQVGDGKEKKVLTYSFYDLKEKTLNDFADDINNLGLNITARHESQHDGFNIYNKTGGAENKISIGVYTGGIKNDKDEEIPGLTDPDAIKRTKTLFNNLHFAAYNSADNRLETELQLDVADSNDMIETVSGVTGEVIIDGRKLTTNDNKVTMAGVEYTLNKEGSTKATVSSDIETVVDNVKKFVEDYNKMIDSMNQSIYEKSYSDYLPLTDDEKSGMSDEQIKKWEEKAKSGLLYRDDILRDIVGGMRSALSQPISGIGKYNSAANIGITTTNYTEHGKIELDEKKLREALAADPDCAYKIFTTDEGDTEENGLVSRLSATVKEGMDKISQRAGLDATSDDQSALGLKIASLQEKMKRFQDQMDAQQARLYKQFNAMESAIASLNSQYNFVNSFTSGG